MMYTNENDIGKPSIFEREMMMKQRMKELQREYEEPTITESISKEKEEIKKEETPKDNPFYPTYRSLKFGDLVYLKDNSNNVSDIKGIVVDFIGTDHVQVQLVHFPYKVVAERNKVEII